MERKSLFCLRSRFLVRSFDQGVLRRISSRFFLDEQNSVDDIVLSEVQHQFCDGVFPRPDERAQSFFGGFAGIVALEIIFSVTGDELILQFQEVNQCNTGIIGDDS